MEGCGDAFGVVGGLHFDVGSPHFGGYVGNMDIDLSGGVLSSGGSRV